MVPEISSKAKFPVFQAYPQMMFFPKFYLLTAKFNLLMIAHALPHRQIALYERSFWGFVF
jgi:hypothetical protein